MLVAPVTYRASIEQSSLERDRKSLPRGLQGCIESNGREEGNVSLQKSQSTAGFQSFYIGGATYIECLGGAHFSLAPFGTIFVGFMDMFRITIEAVVELHVALR